LGIPKIREILKGHCLGPFYEACPLKKDWNIVTERVIDLDYAYF